jgi:hypothetical protein
MGCVVCTVVKDDSAMINFVKNGHEYLEPFLRFRRLLVDIEHKLEYREPFPRDRRTAKLTTRPASRKKSDAPLLGGLNLAGRQLLLKELLKMQDEILDMMEFEGIEIEGGYQVISDGEIQRIKSWWSHLDNFTEPGFVPEPVVKKVIEQGDLFEAV